MFKTRSILIRENALRTQVHIERNHEWFATEMMDLSLCLARTVLVFYLLPLWSPLQHPGEESCVLTVKWEAPAFIWTSLLQMINSLTTRSQLYTYMLLAFHTVSRVVNFTSSTSWALCFARFWHWWHHLLHQCFSLLILLPHFVVFHPLALLLYFLCPDSAFTMLISNTRSNVFLSHKRKSSYCKIPLFL